MTATTTSPAVREAVETVAARLVAMRNAWLTRCEIAEREPSSRKRKAERDESRVRYQGACDIASHTLNALTGAAYTPFGLEVRVSDLAAAAGSLVITWESSKEVRAAASQASDAVVHALAEEALAR